jgi:hypothetical protein
MVPQRHKVKHLNCDEMYAVLHALGIWTTESSVWKIKLYCHNMAVVAALTKGSINCQGSLPLRQTARYIALHQIVLYWVWIQTKENALADALSRWDSKQIAHIGSNSH